MNEFLALFSEELLNQLVEILLPILGSLLSGLVVVAIRFVNAKAAEARARIPREYVAIAEILAGRVVAAVEQDKVNGALTNLVDGGLSEAERRLTSLLERYGIEVTAEEVHDLIESAIRRGAAEAGSVDIFGTVGSVSIEPVVVES